MQPRASRTRSIALAVGLWAGLAWLPAQADPGDPPAELERLAATAAEGESEQREAALNALSRLDHPRVVDVLRERLTAEGDADLRKLIGALLSERDCLGYYRVVRGWVRDGKRDRAAELIDHAVEERARFLRALDLWAAQELDPGAARERLQCWLGEAGDDDRTANALMRAAELMGLLGKHADHRALYPLLKHGDDYVRIEAVLALTKLTGATCDVRLSRLAVLDRSEHVRRHAVWALYERGGVAGLRRWMQPFTEDADRGVRARATEALSVARIRSALEEGPIAFRYQGQPSRVLVLFRAAEARRPVVIAGSAPDLNQRLRRVLGLLDARAPKYAFFVRHSLTKMTTSADHPTGTFIATRVFNIKPATVRSWSLDHMAKTLVHDATHAYLHIMGEKSGEHRGEAECFQEAFWVEKLLTGRRDTHYRDEVDKLLRAAHWAGQRNY